MKAWSRSLAILSVLALAPMSAFAQENTSLFNTDNLYISLAGLYVMPEDSELSTEVLGHTVTSDLSMKSGIGFLAALGFGDDVGLRGEIELGRRSVDFDKLNGLTISGPTANGSIVGSIPYDGSISTWTVMANGIGATEVWQLRPYIGAGVGFAFADAKEEAQSWQFGDTVLASDGGDASDTMLAYQIMLGVAYPMSESAEIRLGYRYFGTNEGEFDGIKTSLSSHNVEFGIRFRF